MSLGSKDNTILGEVVKLHDEFINARTVHQMKKHPHKRSSAREFRQSVTADKTEQADLGGAGFSHGSLAEQDRFACWRWYFSLGFQFHRRISHGLRRGQYREMGYIRVMTLLASEKQAFPFAATASKIGAATVRPSLPVSPA